MINKNGREILDKKEESRLGTGGKGRIKGGRAGAGNGVGLGLGEREV